MLEGFSPEPDYPGIDEPISTIIGKTEEDVRRPWAGSDQSRHACIEIVSSFRLAAGIPDISGFSLLARDTPYR